MDENDIEMNEDFVAPSSPGGPSNYDDEDGEDLFDNVEQDYAEDADQDRYENVDIDEEEDQIILNADQRRVAEQEMYQRDRNLGRDVYAPVGMTPEDDDLRENMLAPVEFEGDGVNLEDINGPVEEILEEPRVQREVKRKFREFLTAFRDDKGEAVYVSRIEELVKKNERSLTVNFQHLSSSYPTLCIWMADLPTKMLELFDDVAFFTANEMFPNYGRIQDEIHVRLTDVPVEDSLRKLGHNHLNMLIKVKGVVTRRTDVYPQLEMVKYDCMKCGYVLGPFMQKSEEDAPKLGACPQCFNRGPYRLNIAQTVYRNYQKVTLQEPPGSVPAGRVPRSRDVVLRDDLVDTVKPGEEITVTGTYKTQLDRSINIQAGFPVFQTLIEANYIESRENAFGSDTITEEDEQRIIEMSKRANLSQLITNSIAPSIYGHDYIKLAIAFAMFGGQEKKSTSKHRVRGDINILILGDPGTGKSQFLKWIENVAPRAVYATGKGASAVGLTAGVRRDPVTQEWTLQGGALVLADRGICMIDEFDKMNEQDRTSIHEAMEQQSISISKAGIVTRLQARCAVIAAANPVGGRYDGSRTFVENVDLTDPILSRFDILAVVRDKVNIRRDTELAHWVVDNHLRSHPDPQPEDDEILSNEKPRPEHLNIEDFRKYVQYAKSRCRPRLDNIDRNKIANFYSDLRQKSLEGGGIPIAVRHIESIMRMSEAHARMHLREMVVEEDVNIAIRTLLQSFIATQRQAVATTLKNHFQDYLQYKRDNVEILLHILDNIVEEASHLLASGQDVVINKRRFAVKAQSYNIHDCSVLFTDNRFGESGYVFDAQADTIIRSAGGESTEMF